MRPESRLKSQAFEDDWTVANGSQARCRCSRAIELLNQLLGHRFRRDRLECSAWWRSDRDNHFVSDDADAVKNVLRVITSRRLVERLDDKRTNKKTSSGESVGDLDLNDRHDVRRSAY